MEKHPFIKTGLKKILYVCHNDGNFLSFYQFSEKCHLETPFTFYFGLINSIPTNWKLAIKRTPREKCFYTALQLYLFGVYFKTGGSVKPRKMSHYQIA